MEINLDTAPQEPVNSQLPEPANNTAQQDILTTAKVGGISFIGKLFEYGVRFVLSIVVARSVGAEQFGLYTLGLTVVSIASMLVLLGLQTGMVRYLPPAIRQRDHAAVWGIIQIGAGLPTVLGLVLAVGLFLLADPLAIYVFKEPQLAVVFRLVSLCIPFEAINFITFTIIQSYKRLEYAVLANNLVLPLTKLLLTVLFLYWGLGTVGIVAAHVTATGVCMVLLVVLVNSLFSLKRSWKSARRNPGQLLRYSLPAHVGWMMNTIRGTFETLVLGILGLTTGVGVFAAVGRFTVVGSMFFASIASISAPIIADLYSRREIAQLKAFYTTTTRWLVTFNLLMFLTCVIFAGPLLAIFGDEFTSGAESLMILAFSTLVYAGTGVGATVLDFTDHPKVNSINSIIMIVITIGLDLFFIPRWGVTGAATASALSTILVNLICLLQVFFLVHMLPYDWSFLKPFAAGIAAAAVGLLFNHFVGLPGLWQLAAGILVLWSVYLLVLILLGFSEEDLSVLNRLFSRLKLNIPMIRRNHN